MQDICSLFDVCNNADIPNGFIVEDCLDYSDDLGDAVIYCREERKEDVIAWIEDNVKINVDYIVNLFKSNPETCVQYLKKFLGITTFTEVIVDECGSIQAFLDKYCKVGIVAEEMPADELELAEELELVGELEVATEELVGVAAEVPIDNEEDDTDEDVENWEPEAEPILDDEPEYEDEIAEYEEEIAEPEEEPVLEEIVEPEEVPVVEEIAEPKEEPVLEEPEEEPVVDEIAEPKEVQIKNDVISVEDLKSIVSDMVSATSSNRDEAMLMRMQAEQMLRDVERKSRILEQNYGTISKYFTPEGDFVGFNDEKRYVETLEALKKLDKRICMGSIDPSGVLDKVQLSKAIDNLGNYSPAVFKMFMLNLVTEADSERDRLRVSALLNDFAAFVEEGCKTW